MDTEPGAGHRPKTGLPRRACVTCGREFTPYRESHIACSEKCLKATPEYKASRNAAQRSAYVPKVPRAEQACIVCGEDFTPYRSNQVACSRKCRDRQPGYVEAGKARNALPEVRERKNAARRVENNPSRRAHNTKVNLRRNYGMTVEEYERMFAEQGGVCYLCGVPPKGPGNGAMSSLHVDHDHVTGANRGLLCGRCNMGVGYFSDDPELMERAAAYIRDHRN